MWWAGYANIHICIVDLSQKYLPSLALVTLFSTKTYFVICYHFLLLLNFSRNEGRILFLISRNRNESRATNQCRGGRGGEEAREKLTFMLRMVVGYSQKRNKIVILVLFLCFFWFPFLLFFYITTTEYLEDGPT